MTNTITSKTLIDAIASGDSMPMDDVSASGTTKRYTPTYMSNYIYNLLSGAALIADCRVATTTALTVSYSNGSSGVGATLTNGGAQAAISIDSVTLALNDRVLVKNQAAPAQNGIYKATTLGSVSTNWVLTRVTDYDQAAEMILNTYTNVTAGTTNANTTWINTSVGTIVVGTTAINFARPHGAIVSPTNSLTLSGAFNGVLTITADTNVTLPTSGTLVNSAVTTLSSLTSIGTIGTGVWQGTVVAPAYGGTGIANNAASTITISGNFATTLTVSNTTSVTLPTTGTLTTLATVLATANSWGATQTYADNVITGAELKDFSETTQTVAAATTTTVDYTAGGIVNLTQDTAITTFNITNPSPTGKTCKLVIIRTKDNTGTARLITWPSGTIWPNGTIPTLSSTANAVDIFTLITKDAGTTWYGFIGGQAFA